MKTMAAEGKEIFDSNLYKMSWHLWQRRGISKPADTRKYH